MDIVLPTKFNNPNLPIIQRPGFTDAFDRAPADALGSTDDGKDWSYFGFAPWKIVAPNHAAGFGTSNHAVVDGLTPDGVLSTVIGKAATSSADKRAGLVFRMLDRDNYLYVCPNTSNTLTFYGRVSAATAFSQAITGQTLATGDTLAIAMVGSQITIRRNGIDVATRTVPDLAGQTLHGFYGNASCDAEFDSIEFAV